MNVLSLLNKSVRQAYADIKELEGSSNLRGILGVEDHFRWRIMYHLEEKIRTTFFQSLEIKLGHPPQRKHQPQIDLGLFKIQTQSEKSSKSLVPILICELKMTGFSQLFEGKKEVKKDFTKLIELVNFLSINERVLPQFFGLIYYIESPFQFESFMAKRACPDLWHQNQELLPNRYFEIIVRQHEDQVSFKVFNEKD